MAGLERQGEALSTILVPFQGADLVLINKAGEPYVAMRPMVEGLGLDWKGQHEKLTGASRWSVGLIPTQLPGDTQRRDVLCMPLKKFPGWLMTLQPSRFKHKKSAALIRIYQEECDGVLWDYWTKGHAVNPRISDLPADWPYKQGLPEKLEQTRGCAKGTYELVKGRVLPLLEQLLDAETTKSSPYYRTSQDTALANLLDHVVALGVHLRQMKADALASAPSSLRQDDADLLRNQVAVLLECLKRRGDAAPEVLMAEMALATVKRVSPTPGVPYAVTMAARTLARHAPMVPRKA